MKIKRYDFSRKPRKPSKLLMKLSRLLVVPHFLHGREVTVEKIGMDGIEPPYLLFVTHCSLIDYGVLYHAIAPYTAHFVCALSGVRDVGSFYLSRMGCFYKRAFVNEITTIRHMRTCVERDKSVMCIFPESRYSFDGTSNTVPRSLGKMGKLMKVPVAVLRMHGNFLTIPQWNDTWRNVPIKCELELLASAEEVRTLPAEELQERIRTGLKRDDFAYQLKNGIRIEEKDRAQGLHRILYQCPHCGKEETASSGTRLMCGACGKVWELSEYGVLKAVDGETEFPHIPDWMNWQRENVRREIRSGTYRFEDEVAVHTLPHYKKFYHHGKGKLVQTAEGTVLECVAYGEEKRIVWEPKLLEGIHIEFNYPSHKRTRKDNRFGDCAELSTADDSYWVVPLTKKNCVMKLSLATEEIYALALEAKKTREDSSD